jgi:hypothetical protein
MIYLLTAIGFSWGVKVEVFETDVSFDNSYYYAGILEVPCGVKVEVFETDVSFDNSYYYAGILEVPCGVKVQVFETDVKAIRKQKLAETLLVLKNRSQRLHCLCKNILKRFFW